MAYLGIDPGKAGALALLDAHGASRLVRVMPLVEAQRGEYDLAEICRQLREWHAEEALFVTVEKSQPMPMAKGGTVANFERGRWRGWEWMLVALGVPYQLVAPRTWQAKMHAGCPDGDTKARSIIAAQRLFPLVDLRATTRCRIPHDGIAEALLLAEFGRRAHRGESAG